MPAEKKDKAPAALSARKVSSEQQKRTAGTTDLSVWNELMNRIQKKDITAWSFLSQLVSRPSVNEFGNGFQVSVAAADESDVRDDFVFVDVKEDHFGTGSARFILILHISSIKLYSWKVFRFRVQTYTIC